MNPLVRFCASSCLALVVLAQGCATGAAPRANRGQLVETAVVKSFERARIDQGNRAISLSGPALCDVKVVQLTYRSIGVRQEPVTLSAGLFVPENCPGPYPVLAEAHGTQSDRKRLTTEAAAGGAGIAFFAARGYVVVATDYLGLGQSDYPFHPYLHADSQSSAIVDSIRAARAAAQTLGVPLRKETLLVGYSQGGHAAMAAQREIERHFSGEISLAASAPMAGPYALSQTFLSTWFGQTNGEDNALAPELLAYTLLSYSRIYPDVCAKLSDCFVAPYANAVQPLFPGAQNLFQIRKQNVLPPGGRLNDLRTPAFTAAFLVNEGEPFRAALKRNDLLDWAPTTPTMLCGSRRDAIVDFNNSYAAQAAFRARGVDVPLVDTADQAPSDASGMDHHIQYGMPLCYAAARSKLFDPLLRNTSSSESPSHGTR